MAYELGARVQDIIVPLTVFAAGALLLLLLRRRMKGSDIDPSDPAWQGAMRPARESVPLLRELFPANGEGAPVKVALPTAAGSAEHAWAQLEKLGTESLRARLVTPLRDPPAGSSERIAVVDGRFVDRLAALLLAFVLTSCSVHCAAQRAPADGLEIFKAWLDRAHPGYACDEGPARFRNPTVEAAYAGRRFYYVLTYTRGIPPPFQHQLSVVAHVDDNGNVTSLNSSSPATYRPGLRKVSTAKDARQAAAAVLILAMGDPGERRWKFQESMFTVKKDKKGWVCTYRHGDKYHTSQVTFDRDGELSTIRSNPPPVP